MSPEIDLRSVVGDRGDTLCFIARSGALKNLLESVSRIGFAFARRGLAFGTEENHEVDFCCCSRLGVAVFSGGAQASVVMNISAVGGDVVAMASGTLNLGGLSFF